MIQWDMDHNLVTRYLLSHFRTMALLISCSCRQLTVFPAKAPVTCTVIRRTPSVIVQPTPCPTLNSFSSSYISSEHISAKFFTNHLRAYPPQKYTYPDPIPEFAEAETQKFRSELLKKLSKDRETFGDDLNAVIEVCVEVFNDFLHKEYGGPGTLLVEPFTYILIALKERKLPGALLAARTSLLWAQNNVDQDWEIWISKPPK